MIFEPIVDSKRPYCGPRAISILTGVPTSRAEFMIRRIRRGYRNAAGRQLPIKGTYTGEVRKVLKRLGCKVEDFKTTEPTVIRFAADVQHAGTFLVNVTGHYLVVDAGMIADGSTDMKPVPAAEFRKPAWRVQRAWRIKAPATPRYTPADPLGPRRQPKATPPAANRPRMRLDRLLARLKAWEAKRRRADRAMVKLRRQIAGYTRRGIKPV